MTKVQSWIAACAVALIAWGCGDSSMDPQPPAATPTAGTGTVQATAGATSSAGTTAGTGSVQTTAGAASSAGTSAGACPTLPSMSGIVLNPCCLSDNTCGVDGTTLNRTCITYTELKKFFNFVTPPPTHCDGRPVTAGSAAGGGAGAGGP